MPPTAVTYREVAGYSAPVPSSPELTVMATPGWFRYVSSEVSVLLSSPPQLLETYLAPSETAVLMAVNNGESSALLASTSRMWQAGHVAETMSRSSEISPAQPLSAVGSGDVWPLPLTFLKQPLAVVQAARPYWVR